MEDLENYLSTYCFLLHPQIDKSWYKIEWAHLQRFQETGVVLKVLDEAFYDLVASERTLAAASGTIPPESVPLQLETLGDKMIFFPAKSRKRDNILEYYPVKRAADTSLPRRVQVPVQPGQGQPQGQGQPPVQPQGQGQPGQALAPDAQARRDDLIKRKADIEKMLQGL